MTYDAFDSDTDDDFLQDIIQGLSTACGAPRCEKPDAVPSDSAAGSGWSGGADGNWSGDSEDERELLGNIQRNYGDGNGFDINRPLSLKPLHTLPPISPDDDEDDLETLLAIQRRFSQYCGGRGDTSGLKDSPKQDDQSYGVGTLSDDRVLDNQLVHKIVADHKNAAPSGNYLSGDGAGSSYEFDQSEDHSSCEFQLQTSTLPKSALAFVHAIKKNRSCQKFLRDKIIHIEARIDEVEKLKERVKVIKVFQIQCKKIIGRVLSNKEDVRVQLISSSKHRPHSKDPNKKASPLSDGPLENAHVGKHREALARFPISLDRGRWYRKEREELKKGLIQQFRKLLFLCSTDSESLSMALQHGNDVDQMMSSIRDVEITPEEMRMIIPKVDWEQLASMYVPRHSGAECEARWLNFEDPLLDFSNWTALDDKKLLHTVEQRGIHNWIGIASLQTNRTPFQCLARYQRSLNASILRSSWTADEDELLRTAVEEFGESNWQAVASALEGRTGTQCSNRWKKAIHPTIEKRGRWAQEEDTRLKVGMMIIGPKWHIIAHFVPGRTQAQCRDRWVNNLDPSVNMGEWTEDEDLKLRAAIKEHGYRWSRVAACVQSRTDCQCRMRWKELYPEEALLLQAARDIQKTALISNFVDRESLRPNLGPKDFIALPPPGPMPRLQKLKRKRAREKTDKTSAEAAFCNIPRNTRSKRRRRVYECCEIPVIGGCSVVGTVKEGDSSSEKERFARHCMKKKKKHVSAGTEGEDDALPIRNERAMRMQDQAVRLDSSISDVHEMASNAGNFEEYRKERMAKKSGLKRKRDGKNLQNQSVGSGSRLSTEDNLEIEMAAVDGFTCKEKPLREQVGRNNITPAETTCGDVAALRSAGTERTNPSCIETEAAVLSKKRKCGGGGVGTGVLQPDESDAWDHSTLAELFGDIVMRIKRKKKQS